MKRFLTGAFLAIGLALGATQFADAQSSANGPLMAVVPGSSPMKVIVAGGSADGKTVNLARGSAVQIDFAEQLGTGYSWSEKNCSNAGSVISQIKAQHVDSPGPGFPGKASVASFTFTADAPGACTVEFIYARPWIPQDPTAQTVTVTFAVK